MPTFLWTKAVEFTKTYCKPPAILRYWVRRLGLQMAFPWYHKHLVTKMLGSSSGMMPNVGENGTEDVTDDEDYDDGGIWIEPPV